MFFVSVIAVFLAFSASILQKEVTVQSLSSHKGLFLWVFFDATLAQSKICQERKLKRASVLKNNPASKKLVSGENGKKKRRKTTASDEILAVRSPRCHKKRRSLLAFFIIFFLVFILHFLLSVTVQYYCRISHVWPVNEIHFIIAIRY